MSTKTESIIKDRDPQNGELTTSKRPSSPKPPVPKK